MQLQPGSDLGRYRVLSFVGSGGMGEVYRAEDTKLGREVAIKVLPERLSGDRNYRERLAREAKTISRLQHPNVCTLYDLDSVGGRDFLVMELLSGETLEERLRPGPLTLEEVHRIGRDVAEAIAAAHEAGLVHRDLKPGNILLTQAGAKVLDFGLAKDTAERVADVETQALTAASPLTVEGALVGTMPYMSPEQLEGRPADSRTDIWALGCIVYEMATGERPFSGRTQASLITSIMGAEPDPPSRKRPLTPASLDRVVQRCLRKDPMERWQSARDVSLELAELAASNDGGDAAPWPRWRRALGWLAPAMVVLVVGAWWVAASTESEPVDPSQGGPRPPEIAVLPFDNVGEEPTVEPLALGIAVELTARLSEYQALGQAGPVDQAIAARYRDQDVCEAADGMQVRLVYDGSVRRAGTRVRVTAELIGCPEREQLWGQSFDREFTDLLSLQEEIARSILAATERILRFDNRFSESGSPRYFFNRRTPEDNEWALAMLREQRQQGTSDSELYDLLPNVLVQRFQAGWDESPQDLIAELDGVVAECFEKRIRRDLCVVWSGFTAIFTGESERLVRSMEEFVEEQGDLPVAHAFLGQAYALTGRTEEALTSLNRAFEMSPEDPSRAAWHGTRGTAYSAASNYEAARDAVKAGIAVVGRDYTGTPASLYRQLAGYQAMLGEHEAAADAWQEYLRLGGPSDWATISLGWATVSEERRNQFRESLRMAGMED